MFTCKWFDKLLDDHLAGKLGKFRTFVFRMHMKLCPPCQKYLDEYHRTVKAAHEQHDCAQHAQPLPRDLAERIGREIENDPSAHPK